MSTIVVSGNIVREPELRFTNAGLATCKITVADSKKKFDKETREWVDDGTTFMDCVFWGKTAENVAASVEKGQRTIVIGRLQQREYTNKEGQKRTFFEVMAEDVGLSIKFKTAKFMELASSQAVDPWNNKDDEPPF